MTPKPGPATTRPENPQRQSDSADAGLAAVQRWRACGGVMVDPPPSPSTATTAAGPRFSRATPALLSRGHVHTREWISPPKAHAERSGPAPTNLRLCRKGCCAVDRAPWQDVMSHILLAEALLDGLACPA